MNTDADVNVYSAQTRVQTMSSDDRLPDHEYNAPMRARLQARLTKPLKAAELQKLRKMHRLSSYYRTKSDILSALKAHECTDACKENDDGLEENSVPLAGRKRKTREDETPYVTTEWPYILSEDEKKKIIREFVESTSDNSLSFEKCSFCGVLVQRSFIRRFSHFNLDISLLEKMGNLLKERWRVNEVSVAEQFEGQYAACRSCQECIKGRRFVKAPLYSYANGCWIGDVPPQLKNLTFLEELCIARARCTRCVIKLSGNKFSQYASHGNVCVFPQEPKNLIAVLPPPLHSLFDEIAIILVPNNSTPIDIKTLERSPLLVRRYKIANALEWLKEHNPFYADINICTTSLSQYPINSVPYNCPMQHVFETTGESSSYTNHSTIDVTMTDGPQPGPSNFILQSCGVLDTDHEQTTYAMRKLDMIREILENKQPFVKYPSSDSEPMLTFRNPSLYAFLWPCLFPYGVGLLEDDVRYLKSDGFRQIDLKRHVRHLMTIADTRFQKHVMFPFVMMNLLQRRTSSFQSRLVLKRSWFPKVMKVMNDIDIKSLDHIKEKFSTKAPMGDSVSENAVRTLLKYVNYMSEDITGSIGEVHKMKHELWSIVRSVGLPHIFVTINPADMYNPIVQKFCGHEIDLDLIFHNLFPGNEDPERIKASVDNPAATVRIR